MVGGRYLERSKERHKLIYELGCKSFLQKFSKQVINVSIEESRFKKIDEQLSSILQVNNVKNKIFIREQDEFRKIIIFLKALDYGFCPIIIPLSWKKCDFDSFFQKFDENYFLVNEGSISSFKANKKNNKDDETSFYGVFSSGTTGKPQIYFHSKESAILNSLSHTKSLGLDSESIILKTLSVDHSFGLCAYIWSSLFSDVKIYFLENFYSWEQLSAAQLKNSIIHFTPRQVLSIIKRANGYIDYPQKISIGSDYLSQPKLKELSSICTSDFYVTYGLTEAGPRVSTGRIQDVNQIENESEYYLGQPIDGVEVVILNDEGRILEKGDGKLAIKSKSMALNLPHDSIVSGFYVTKDRVRISDKREIFLQFKNRSIFKYQDRQIDLEILKKQFDVNDESSIYAVKWRKQMSECWALILIAEQAEYTTLEVNSFFSIDIRPSKIVRYLKSELTALDKMTDSHLRDLLSLEQSTEMQVYRTQV